MDDRPFATPTGEPCPRCVRVDGALEGGGACVACGCCLLLLAAAWPDDYEQTSLDVPAAESAGGRSRAPST